MKTLFTLLIASILVVNAQAQTGKVVGVVYDENGETIPGVSVFAEGIAQGKSTDIDGKFIFPLPVGTYNMIFKFVSYKTQKIPNVVVKADQITDLTVSLKPQDDSVLTDVDIVVHLSQAEDPGMDLARKKSPNFQDGLTQGTMRKLPIVTAGDAIRRVTGASIQDGRFAVIRGMGDRYNAAYINGAPLPSSESDRRAIAFDIFPSNMLDNITIIKTGTPNVPGEFAGGIIQINTKSIPDETSQSVTFGPGYNSLATFKNFSTYNGGKYDWLGFDDGTRALNSGIPNTQDLRGANALERASYAKLMNSDWSINNVKASPNITAQYTLGLADTLFGNQAGLVFGVNYSNNNSVAEIDRQEYEEQAAGVIKTDTLHDRISSNNILGSALLNMAYKFGERHIIKFNNLYSVNSEDRVTVRSGARFFEQTDKQWEKGSIRWFTQNTMYSGQLMGSHQLWKKIRFEWNGGYSNVMRNIPNMRRMVYQKYSRYESDPSKQYAAVIDPNNARSGGIMFFSDLNEKIYSAKYDLTIPFEFKKSKKFSFDFVVGGLNQYRDRTFSARNIGYDKYKLGTSVKFNYNLLYLNEGQIFSPDYIGQMPDTAAPYNGGFTIKETTRTTDSYSANSSLNAGYGMFDFKIGKMLRLIAGARYENYHQYLETMDNGKPSVIDTTVNDLLPSANLVFTYDHGKSSSLIMRAAYYRTVTRPEFRELASFSFYDFVTDFLYYGNPSLKRGLIDNYDFRVEYYPLPGQIISGSVFYKNITNPTELTSRSDQARALYYVNVPNATNIGAELEYRVKLSYFTKVDTTEFVQNTNFFANFTYVKSKVDVSELRGTTQQSRPLQGQSPYLINAGLSIFIPGAKVIFTGSYNISGPRLYIVGNKLEPDYWEKPRNVIDCQLARDFGKRWTVRLNVRDLLAQRLILYQDLNHDGKYNVMSEGEQTFVRQAGKGVPATSSDNTMVNTRFGRVFSLNVTYKF